MMIKISVFIPSSHLELVKQAMFTAGAGKIGDYDCCSWQTLGIGQFRPLANATPFIGEASGGIETVEEYKVEMVCEKSLAKSVITAMRKAHPYEEPAFDVIALIDIENE